MCEVIRERKIEGKREGLWLLREGGIAFMIVERGKKKVCEKESL